MADAATGVIDLAGDWALAIEGEVVRESAPPDFAAADVARLPGSLQEQGFGDEVTFDAPWTPGAEGDRAYYNDDRYAPYRVDGSIKTPFALQPDRMYVGAASYQRQITIPSDWQDTRKLLWLERPHWSTEVWIDGKLVGRGESLSTPHEIELPQDLAPGEHTLVVRVDNRLLVDVGESAHSVSDHTQTNWNGIVGKIELRATPRVWVDRVRVTGELQDKRFRVAATIGNATEERASGRLVVEAKPRDGGEPTSASVAFEAPAGGADVEVVVELGADARLWDEFDPNLYDLSVTSENANGSSHTETLTAGLREVATAGTQIIVNGRPVFLRGTLECCVFPKTGYPPTDVAAWRAVFERCQEFGLNHVRFHSYCPPEAAFAAADEMGIYLQPEAAAWAYVGDGKPVDAWILAETRRILDAYGNHPSFIMMAYGNEPWPQKPTRDVYLGDWVERFRAEDPRRIYSCASGWPTLQESDFHVLPRPRLQQWGEGMKSRLNSKAPTTMPDYRGFVQRHNRPVVAHEIGQWCAYPNFAEREKYTGVTRATNFDIFEDFLTNAGMADQAEDFLAASGALQELCYKEEVEASIRTPGLAGFQLLGLSDFPGQGTALVGLCDAFWDVKPYASAERFRSYCDQVVVLARLPKRAYQATDTLEAELEVANYGPDALTGTNWNWRLEADGQTLGSGRIEQAKAPTGTVTSIGSVVVDLSEVQTACRAELIVEGSNGIGNRWSVWVYPTTTAAAEEGAIVVRSFDDSTRRLLDAGESVVLFADPQSVESDVQVGFTSIFWNTSYTKGQAPHTLGVLVDPSHAAFRGFPTASHSDWQWWEVLAGCKAMHLDALPADVRPVVQIVPDWFDPERLALVFETRVGAGRLLVCSAELEQQLEARHAARAFRQSLLDYAASDDFNPSATLTPEQVLSLFSPTP